MCNCVGRRARNVVDGSMKIVFMRKKDEPQNSLVSIVLNKDDNVIWAITKNHIDVKGFNRLTVYKWISKVGKGERRDLTEEEIIEYVHM